MKIEKINSTYYKPNFGTTEKESYKNGRIQMRNVSWVFREYGALHSLMKIMKESYKDKEQVNIINCACSDGSEAYSLAILLNENFPIKEERNKFLPIICCDIDENILKYAKSRKINLSGNDIMTINSVTNNYFNEYFKNPDYPMNIENDIMVKYCLSYEVNPYLKFATQFKKSDALEELNQLKDEGNTVFMFKNATQYLDEKHLNTLLKTLDTKLKPGSLAVFGDYDNIYDITAKLNNKFKIVGPNIFKKVM